MVRFLFFLVAICFSLRAEPFAPPDSIVNDRFGEAVSADAAGVLASAPGQYGLGAKRGAAYLFDAVTRVQLRRIVPPDGASDASFGRAVLLTADHCIIGAPNSREVYLFDRSSGALAGTITPDQVEPPFHPAAAEATSFRSFGAVLAIHNGRLLVGAPEAHTVQVPGSGTIVQTGAVFEFDLETLAQTRVFYPTDGESQDMYGASIKAVGLRLIIGSPGKSGQGAVYYCNFNSGALISLITAPSPTAGDEFGAAITTSDDQIFVGAPGRSGGRGAVEQFAAVGLAHVRTIDGPAGTGRWGLSLAWYSPEIVVGSAGQGVFAQKPGVAGMRMFLHAGDGEKEEGRSFSIAGDRLWSGDRNFQPNPTPTSGLQGPGAVLGYDIDTAGVLGTLEPEDHFISPAFGFSVSIQGEGDLAVGAPGDERFAAGGSVYLFRRNGEAVDWLGKFHPGDGFATDGFGSAVALGEAHVAVGAPRDDDAGVNSGSVYILDRETGTQTVKLTPQSGATNANFGSTLLLVGDVLLVGSPGEAGSGRVHFFRFPEGTVLGAIQGVGAATGARFGEALAVSGNHLLVGAPLDDTAVADSGAAYLFLFSTRSGVTRLTAPSPQTGARFGNSVAITPRKLVVGAPEETTVAGTGSGALHLFDRFTYAFQRQIISTGAGDGFGYGAGAGGHDLFVTRPGHVFGVEVCNAEITPRLNATSLGLSSTTAIAVSGSLVVSGNPDFDQPRIGYGGAACSLRPQLPLHLDFTTPDGYTATKDAAVDDEHVVFLLSENAAPNNRRLAIHSAVDGQLIRNIDFVALGPLSLLLSGNEIWCGQGSHNSSQGKVVVYQISTGAAAFEIASPEPENDALFGYALARNDDGVLIAAPGQSTTRFGNPGGPLVALDTPGVIHRFQGQSHLASTAVSPNPGVEASTPFDLAAAGNRALALVPGPPGSALWINGIDTSTLQQYGEAVGTGSGPGFQGVSIAATPAWHLAGFREGNQGNGTDLRGLVRLGQWSAGLWVPLTPFLEISGEDLGPEVDDYGASIAAWGRHFVVGAPESSSGDGRVFIHAFPDGQVIGDIDFAGNPGIDRMGTYVEMSANRILLRSQNSVGKSRLLALPNGDAVGDLRGAGNFHIDLAADANPDSDGDGISDLAEFLLGTPMLVQNALPLSTSIEGGTFTLDFPLGEEALPFVRFAVEESEDLITWRTSNAPVEITSGEGLRAGMSRLADAPGRFFRLDVTGE